jgi:hypothetical protein
MKASRKITIAAAALIVALLTASAGLLRQIDRVRSDAPIQEVLYISSPKILKRLSLGYTGLLADIYWTRAVQYFGGKHHAGAEHYALLAPLLEITTTLDPHLVIAYDFGANFLAPAPPNGAGLPDEAVRLVQHGIENNPDNWKLYYQLGFILYMQRHDYAGAAEAFARGSQAPNAHPFMKVLAGQMAQHAGDSQMARALWTTTFNSSNDRLIQANALAHLRALQSDDAVTALESLLMQVRERTGKFPESFQELVQAGILRSLPIDPAGHPYKLLPEGKLEVRAPDDLPFILKGLPEGYTPPKKTKLPTDF